MEVKVEEKAGGKNVLITVEGEGNFLGQGLRGVLIKNKDVLGAAAKIEHPLKKTVIISVKTEKSSGVTAVKKAIDEICETSREFGKKVSDEL